MTNESNENFPIAENSHSYFERQLSPDDTLDSLKSFIKMAC